MDAENWDERYRAVERVWPAEANRWVVREAEGLPPGSALDLAAGEGRNALWLAGLGWRVDALDFSPVAVERAAAAAARADLPGSVRAAVADVTALPPGGPGYDLVLLSYLQLPWAELGGVLRRAAGAARSGGTLLLVAHHLSNLEHGTGGPQDPSVLTRLDQVLPVWEEYAAVRLAEVARRPAEGGVALDAVVRAVRY